MSSYNPSVSQPQLLTPQFFEQPPKLLPPSVFRQPVTASSKSEGYQDTSDPTAGECSTFTTSSTCESAVADQKSNEGSTQSDGSVVSKKIKLCSESDPVPDSFDPRHDNQLLLVAENVSYSLAVKQRWKKSAIAADSEGKVTKVEAVLDRSAITTPTRGQRLPVAALDTPTLVRGHLSESSSSSVPVTALWRSSDSSTTSSVSDLPSVHSVVSFPSPEGHDLSNHDKPLISAPGPPSPVSVDNSCRNDLDKVYSGPAIKPHTTDNLKLLSCVESPSTEVNIGSWKVKSQSSSSTSRSDFVSPPHPKDPCHLVDAGKTTSVKSVEAMAIAAVDTESDHVLAQLLQNEEYGHTSGARVPGRYVVEQDVKRKAKKPAMDCSSDFEIARRLQQEADAEVAHSMQRQEDHHPSTSGAGRRLGEWHECLTSHNQLACETNFDRPRVPSYHTVVVYSPMAQYSF